MPNTNPDQQKSTSNPSGPPDLPMSAGEILNAYRKIFGSAVDEQICWWYCGTIFIDIPGYLTIPVVQSETAMVYRVETVSPESFRIHWREIGYFRDPLTGEIAETWINPVTGQTVRCPKTFEEGPGCTTVTGSPQGVDVSLAQPFAIVQGVEVGVSVMKGRIAIAQTECKQRGYPQEDGTLPEPGASGTSEGRTVLSIFGDRQHVNDPGRDQAPASGSYEFGLAALPPWMGFGDRSGRTTVRGVMRKTAIDERPNATAWARLQACFPDCFEDGRLRADWC